MKTASFRCTAVAFIALSLLLHPLLTEGKEWVKLADGLHFGEFSPTLKSPFSDDPVIVIKVDTARHPLRLLSSSEHGSKLRTAREWCEEFGLLAAVNASMYMSSQRSTGYMRNYHHVNNPAVNPAFGAFLLFNPKDPALPPVRWLDTRRDKDWREQLKQYDSAVQNFRMISGGRKVQWPEKDKPHSTAVLALDVRGNVLLILCRTPYTPHNFIDILLALPLQIREAMYLEGGDEASLCIRRNGRWLEWTGINEIPFLQEPGPPRLPNVIGIAER